MFEFIFGIFFIVLGGVFIHSALKLQRTQDINLVKNKMVNIDEIKDKDGYMKFNFKINIIVGVICISQGIIYILAKHFIPVDNLLWITDIITMLTMFMYSYQLICKAPKF